MTGQQDWAKNWLARMELPGLSDTALEDAMERLIQQAQSSGTKVGSICVWPRFVSLCASRLQGKGVRIATVINFPKGSDDVERDISDAEEAAKDGADEIALVFPMAAFKEGDEPLARSMVAEVRDAIPDETILTVILDQSVAKETETLAAAARLAIDEGANGLRSGTGRSGIMADEHLRAILEVVRDAGGTTELVHVLADGGIAELRHAEAVISSVMGDAWLNNGHLRLSGATLHQALLTAAGAGS
jgi:deoxyribose-phosphate aldolase